MSRAAENFKLKLQQKKSRRPPPPRQLSVTPPPSALKGPELQLPGTGPLTDEEFQRAAALQQSVYAIRQDNSRQLISQTSQPAANESAKSRVTVKRTGGGKTWEDSSLLEWDPTHFRLFVGNLSPGVTDSNLIQGFKKYPTMSKCKVVMDHRTGKNKGYGFVAFKDADDYFRAFKEMNGKYIGLRPIQLRRANTELQPTKVKARSKPYDRK
ncbi:Nam8p [Sugiyamaella lignohabitans]|uniref:Nam8p n=1 Tax=Sugiyamaella lignohabitans TaxID=796027 RepID=A0A167DYW2_9ASCO|nr:Nam8p [Sugiyamaella lignohabitans]ANB13455.1 Nam8p [Sugiyamaella lignohabitans]